MLCTKIDQVQGSIKLSRKKLLQMRENKSLHNESNRFDTYVPSKEALNGADSGYNIPTISNMTQTNESQESKAEMEVQMTQSLKNHFTSCWLTQMRRKVMMNSQTWEIQIVKVGARLET